MGIKKLTNLKLGEIGRQTIKGGYYTYLGTALGFFFASIIQPRVLTKEQIGAIGLLIAYSQLLSVLGNLGVNTIITRLFPYFRNKDNGHNGLLAFSILIISVGFLLCIVVFKLFGSILVSQAETNNLFNQYIWLVYPLTLFVLFFRVGDAYNRALGNAVTGSLISEVIQRSILIVFILLYTVIPFIDFDLYLKSYVMASGISTLLIFIYLKKRGELKWNISAKFLRPKLRKVMYSVGGFSILQGFGSVIIQRIDTIMISFYLSLDETGVYFTTFFFGSIILLPQRALSRISSNVLAQALKDKDMRRVESVYKKSSINQLLLGVLLFVGIWGNIENCFHILTDRFQAGRYVIFFIGLANIVNITIGLSNQIISLSKYYRYNAYFLTVFVVIIVASNYLFIPPWGIVGAAVASFTSTIIYSLIMLLFLYRKMKLLPLTINHLYIILIGIVTYFISELLPELDHFVLDILVRSVLILFVYVVFVVVFKVSEEASSIYKQLKNNFYPTR